MATDLLINPQTGRAIKRGGNVYNKLVADGVLPVDIPERRPAAAPPASTATTTSSTSTTTNTAMSASSAAIASAAAAATVVVVVPTTASQNAGHKKLLPDQSIAAVLPAYVGEPTLLRTSDLSQLSYWIRVLGGDGIVFLTGAGGLTRGALEVWREGRRLGAFRDSVFHTNKAVAEGSRFWVRARYVDTSKAAVVLQPVL
jgi:hypothetical protein